LAIARLCQVVTDSLRPKFLIRPHIKQKRILSGQTSLPTVMDAG
jgi:hypothetical protein